MSSPVLFSLVEWIGSWRGRMEREVGKAEAAVDCGKPGRVVTGGSQTSGGKEVRCRV